MLFKGIRVGDEVVLATPAGRGASGGFSYALAEVEAVKSALVVVAGFKFNLKDGKGRTVPHHILPATAANRNEFLGGSENTDPVAGLPATSGSAGLDDKLRSLALDALRIIREEATHDDDVIELLGVETLAAFRRQWRRLNGDRK